MKNKDNELKLTSIAYPIETFIAGPMKAAIDSQVMIANTTSELIHTIGFETIDGKQYKPCTIPFTYNRTVYDSSTEELCTEVVQVDAPLLTLVKIPSLEISSIHYTFSLDIKKVDKEEKNSISISKDPSFKLLGMIAAPKENARNTDHSSKIHLDIHAIQGETPEGMARVLDLMNQSITPKVISRYSDSKQKKENIQDKLLDLVKNLKNEDLLSLVETLQKKTDTTES